MTIVVWSTQTFQIGEQKVGECIPVCCKLGIRGVRVDNLWSSCFETLDRGCGRNLNVGPRRSSQIIPSKVLYFSRFSYFLGSRGFLHAIPVHKKGVAAVKRLDRIREC